MASKRPMTQAQSRAAFKQRAAAQRARGAGRVQRGSRNPAVARRKDPFAGTRSEGRGVTWDFRREVRGQSQRKVASRAGKQPSRLKKQIIKASSQPQRLGRAQVVKKSDFFGKPRSHQPVHSFHKRPSSALPLGVSTGGGP